MAADIAGQGRLYDVRVVPFEIQQGVDLKHGVLVARLVRKVPRPAKVECCTFLRGQPVLLPTPGAGIELTTAF